MPFKSLGAIAVLCWLLSNFLGDGGGGGGGGDSNFVYFSESSTIRTVRNADGSYSSDVQRDVRTNIKGYGEQADGRGGGDGAALSGGGGGGGGSGSGRGTDRGAVFRDRSLGGNFFLDDFLE